MLWYFKKKQPLEWTILQPNPSDRHSSFYSVGQGHINHMAEGTSAHGPRTLGAPRFTQFYFSGAWLDGKKGPKSRKATKVK